MKNNLFALALLLSIGFIISCSSDSGTDNGPVGGSDDDGGVGMVDMSGNLLATGASANDLLSNTNFDRLLIQIGFVNGFRPSERSLDYLQEYIRQHTFKEDIEIELLEVPSPEEETLTLQEIVDLEEENRTAYNEGTTLAVYIYFSDAPSDSDEEDEGLVTLGAVYRNTSMVIFQETIRNLFFNANSSLISLSDLETATLNHEFGHLFGLVNLGTVAINDHEDVNAPNHCNVEGCLMLAELQFSPPSNGRIKTHALQSACSLSGNSILEMLENRSRNASNIVPDLDAECVLDLENNGGRPLDTSSVREF